MSLVAFGPQQAQINTGKAETCINIEKAMLSYTHILSGSKPSENSHPQRLLVLLTWIVYLIKSLK